MNSNTCSKIILSLQELFDNTNVDKGHGVDHSIKVLGHANNTLCLMRKPENELYRNAIRCAALLHDADDRKFFPKSDNYQNARRIMKESFPGKKSMEELTIKMIKLVSCSENGNSEKGVKDSERWMLIPRMCDRLEAIGEIGILRVWSYSKYKNRPLFLPSTPRVKTEKELYEVASSKRFKNYLLVKKSDTMIDHFYDKLLHICSEDVISEIDNPYLRSEMQKRRKIIINFILKFGNEGEIDVFELNRIRVKEWK